MTPSTLNELAPQFDGFLIDQFGVLLDGAGAYPYAITALSALGALDKPIYILSNSGKRAVQNVARLQGFGFPRGAFCDVITSGEVAYWSIGNEIGRTIAPQAQVFLISRDDDTSAIDGLDLRRVQEAQHADVIIIAGSRGEETPLGAYETLLAPAARRGVSAYCTNPDKVMLTERGRFFGAGAIAERYAQMGGQVTWLGKPYPKIYDFALKKLAPIAPKRVLCIGDSVDHDIKGAHGAGCASALVRTGILRDVQLEAYLQERDRAEWPDYVIERFAWEGAA